jgi:hypothetical protein
MEISTKILNFNIFKKIEEDLKNPKTRYPYCIGIDGATATGKTILSKILKARIEKNCKIKTEIFQLDGLLKNRSFREKQVSILRKNKQKFFYEAEEHMDFDKIKKMLNKIKDQKLSKIKSNYVTLNNLYSREKNGRCVDKKTLNLSQVLIFEGHYTSQNLISDYLNLNIILFANRNEILKRKITRSEKYRNSKDVIEYFDLIDQPSISYNFLRYNNSKFFLIDNSNINKPKKINHFAAKNILNISSQTKNKVRRKYADKFLFNINNNLDSKANKIIKKIIKIKKIDEFILEEFLNKNNINYSKYLFTENINQNLKQNCFFIKIDNKVFYLIVDKRDSKFLLSFDHGLFLFNKTFVINLGVQTSKNLKLLSNIKIYKKKFIYSQSGLFENIFKYENFFVNFCYLKLIYTESDKHFLYNFFLHSGIKSSFLSDFCILHLNSVDEKVLKKNNINVNLNYFTELNTSHNYNFIKDKNIYTSKSFNITHNHGIILKKINKNNYDELVSLILSNNYFIRKNIFNALLNYKFLNQKKRKSLNFFLNKYLKIYPTSFSRLYSLIKLLNLPVGILANNVYDLSDFSSDISSYIHASNKFKLPFIIQSSLNAIGQKEKYYSKTISGYLKPADGPKSYIKSISNTILNINKTQKLSNLFYGIGLDHVDLNGDTPKGRTKRFLKKSLSTNSITHLTLDSSKLFNVKSDKLKNLFKTYQKVFDHSNKLLLGTNFYNCDLEFCTGELNYIGKSKKIHQPSILEVSMFEKIYNTSLDKVFKKNITLNQELKNKIKLYVANLGTTHHGKDTEKNLKINIAKDWNLSNQKTNFISPVLHGTTESKNYLFKEASKYCLKVNIAGTYLKILMNNLYNYIKKEIKYDGFNKDTKYLAFKLKDYNRQSKLKDSMALEKAFLKYTKLCNYKDINIINLNDVRSSSYYLSNISEKMTVELKEKLIK